MFKIDKKLCTHCRLCMQACSWAHERPYQSPAYARIRVEDDWPGVAAIHVCMACPKKSCINACPDGALSWDGFVRVDRMRCTGCMECVNACAFGGVMIDPRDGKPMVCDTCDGEFNCVAQCPTKALRRR